MNDETGNIARLDGVVMLDPVINPLRSHSDRWFSGKLDPVRDRDFTLIFDRPTPRDLGTVR